MDHAGKALIDPYPLFETIGLARGDRVADLGCGRTGHFVFPASRVVGDTGIVYAVDVVKDILESIQSRARTEGYDNVHTAWADIERINGVPIPHGSLDVCFLVNVVFMLKDKRTAFTEVGRLLKPGGVAIIVDWAKNLGALGPTPEQKVTPEGMKKLMAGLPFTFIDESAPGEYHFALVFKRA